MELAIMYTIGVISTLYTGATALAIWGNWWKIRIGVVTVQPSAFLGPVGLIFFAFWFFL